MIGTIKSRLAKLEASAMPRVVRIVVVEEENWYGNDAHHLARAANQSGGSQGARTTAAESWYGDCIAQGEARDDQDSPPQA